jgi:hypothetical protein
MLECYLKVTFQELHSVYVNYLISLQKKNRERHIVYALY